MGKIENIILNNIKIRKEWENKLHTNDAIEVIKIDSIDSEKAEKEILDLIEKCKPPTLFYDGVEYIIWERFIKKLRGEQ